MPQVRSDSHLEADIDPPLPIPATGSRWRWATARTAMVGGGVVAVALGLGGASAGATTTNTATSPPQGHTGVSPSALPRPTAAGEITAISGDTITIESRDKTSQIVTYGSTTSFRSTSGTSSASALEVGDFIVVLGTKNAGGSVTATSIMLGTKPTGAMGRDGGANPGRGGPQGTGTPAG